MKTEELELDLMGKYLTLLQGSSVVWFSDDITYALGSQTINYEPALGLRPLLLMSAQRFSFQKLKFATKEMGHIFSPRRR